ncbi:MAG: hypothetical protein WBB85_11725 [Albidovulum sp.]|uniref:hypothetical protein n=1 Tax=Albidovulum sp. TaxID=1872424 RepID=UPI003CBD07E6
MSRADLSARILFPSHLLGCLGKPVVLDGDQGLIDNPPWSETIVARVMTIGATLVDMRNLRGGVA